MRIFTIGLLLMVVVAVFGLADVAEEYSGTLYFLGSHYVDDGDIGRAAAETQRYYGRLRLNVDGSGSINYPESGLMTYFDWRVHDGLPNVVVLQDEYGISYHLIFSKVVGLDFVDGDYIVAMVLPRGDVDHETRIYLLRHAEP